jgi:antitoxin component YwqK of YwqJK toxin-antitoxin module
MERSTDCVKSFLCVVKLWNELVILTGNVMIRVINIFLDETVHSEFNYHNGKLQGEAKIYFPDDLLKFCVIIEMMNYMEFTKSGTRMDI